MGYTTDFSGQVNFDRPLTLAHFNYLRKFSDTRRMKRDAKKAEKLDDPFRIAAGVPIGTEGGYYVGDSERGPDIVDGNKPPAGQPGLWCQWTVNDTGTALEWNEAEKFYDYVEWLQYLITHFYKPWGYTLNGVITWAGEDRSDVGTIEVANNVVKVSEGIVGISTTTSLTDEGGFEKLMGDITSESQRAWEMAGGKMLTMDELHKLKDAITKVFVKKK